MRPTTPRSVVRTQDALVRLLGNSVAGRPALVRGMLRRDASEATSYWLQLIVSVGIATLGLVVGSAAVVIGAMLIAPLMGPIVGLAMGFASGSPFLVLRSAGRIGVSVVFAVGGAALITLLLPFHELNAEILARTSPTVLDLITAGFCALAGVYAALRASSDAATAAAGTSIGISLVPPLCASGYGFGTANWGVAGGAALLFLTNLAAIIVVGTMAFVAAGFNRVDVVELEGEELLKEGKDAPVARLLARRMSRLFASKWGPILRFLMPFALLGAVYVPLRSALDEVAWQVSVRAAVRDALSREPARVVQSRVRVERHEVELVLVVLGSNEVAERARARLDAELRAAAGVAPRIEVLAVPDANAFAGLESTLLKPAVVETVAPPPPAPDVQLATGYQPIRALVEARWPATSAGAVLALEVSAAEAGPLQLRIVHLGAPVGASGVEALRLALSAELARPVEIADVAIPLAPLTRERGDLQFVAALADALRASSGVPGVRACVTRPEPPPRRRPSVADAELARALDGVLAPYSNVDRLVGDAWTVRFVLGACRDATVPTPAPPG
ncbi:MAG: DUF389 domain-containing protein [Kofleriaceae bacterium]